MGRSNHTKWDKNVAVPLWCQSLDVLIPEVLPYANAVHYSTDSHIQHNTKITDICGVLQIKTILFLNGIGKGPCYVHLSTTNCQNKYLWVEEAMKDNIW